MKSISWGSVVVMVAALAIPGELAFSGETGDSPVTLSEPSDQQGLRHYFGAPAIVGKEDEFCRRAYQVMLKGAAFCKDLYHEWPTEPDCGYIGWGGHAEKEINANIQMAYLYALVAHFGQYDGQVTGVSREEALRRVRGVIRYCAFTHFSGPHRCTSGKSWGGGWHDASWSSGFARMVWLCWPDLDDETREMAARVIVAEADRFVDAQPTSRKIDDTKAESNAWNTRSLAVAVTMFPNHPRASKWRDAYHRWTMNTLSVAADQNDDTLIEGKPVREWVTTENIHSDFTLENHDIVYPVYMWCSMDGLCQGASSFVIAGQRVPQTAHHHLRDIYEVYKRLQTWEGLPAYVNGSDKFLHMQVVDIIIHSYFAQVFQDREAAHLELVELELLEKMQSRFADGRIYPVEEVGPWSRVGDLAGALGASYLLHYVCQSDVMPVSCDEFEARISGVTEFPDGKFLHHRMPDKLVTFAWSKPHRVMGLVIPREGSWLVTPHTQGFTGAVREQGKKLDSRIDVQELEKNIGENSFSISVRALRCKGKVEHHWTFSSLASGEVVMKHKMIAREPVILDVAETGTMGIGRELESDQLTLVSAERKRVVDSRPGSEDEIIEFPEGEVTVGGRFTYAWQGGGTICYVKRHDVAKVYGAPGGYGRIEDRLVVRHLEAPRRFAAGDTIAEGELTITTHRMD